MKRLLLVAGVIMLPMRAGAQLLDPWNLGRNLRMRDRNIKFSSPRLEALQMSAAIEDEANDLNLDTWGDNRAWLGARKDVREKAPAAGDTQSEIALLEKAKAEAEKNPLTNKRIISLSKSGVSDNTIILLINKFPVKLDGSPEGLGELYASGVSDEVFNAVSARVARQSKTPPGLDVSPVKLSSGELHELVKVVAEHPALSVAPQEQIKLDTAFGSGKYSGALAGHSNSYSGMGMYGRFGGFEAEGLGRSQDYTGPTDASYTNADAGAGWGHESGGFLMGLHWNDNSDAWKSRLCDYLTQTCGAYYTDKSRYTVAGAAIAFRVGAAAIGLTGDAVNFAGSNGPRYGAQAVIDSNGFKAGLRVSVIQLHNSWNELGAKVLWTINGSPVTFGLEYSGLGVEDSNSNDVATKIAAGTALKLFKGHILIGVEYKYFGDIYKNSTYASRDTWHQRFYTAGMELRPVERLALRGSYQQGLYKESGYNTTAKDYTTAAGLGYRLSDVVSADVLWRRARNTDFPGTYFRSPYVRTDGELTVTARF